jgi:hypothetical protein
MNSAGGYASEKNRPDIPNAIPADLEEGIEKQSRISQYNQVFLLTWKR